MPTIHKLKLLPLFLLVFFAAKAQIGDTDNFGVEMVFVEGGFVQMGLTMEEYLNLCEELAVSNCEATLPQNSPIIFPSDTIEVSDFYIDKYEVSVQQYIDCVDADVCSAEPLIYIIEYLFYDSASATLRLPMNSINNYEAAIYCAWRAGRLPNAYEWVYAASGTVQQVFPWGNDFNGIALNFCDQNCNRSYQLSAWNDGYSDLAPVDSFTDYPSAFGLVNMSGNVSEWIGLSANPSEPSSSIVRGGSYLSSPQETAVQHFTFQNPSARSRDLGFRCLLTTNPFTND